MKSRRSLKYKVLMILVLAGTGCAKKENPIIPPGNDGSPQPTLFCSPDSGYIGDIVAIEKGSFEVPAYMNFVSFASAIEKRADSGTTTRICTDVPFGASTGRITVYTSQSSAETQTFKMREIYNPLTMNVVWYNLSTPITANDSSVVDPMGQRRTWKATMHHDTVDIYRDYASGMTYTEYHFLLLNKGANQLPQFLIAWRSWIDDTGLSNGDTLHEGILKIQNWDANTTLSAKYIGKPWQAGPYTFWIGANNIQR